MVVDRANSWVVEGYQGDSLLRHEQGHYDIMALGARELYNRVLELTASRCPEINTQDRQLQQQIQAQVDAANIRYDTRTNHGNTASVQQNWEPRIHAIKQNPTGIIMDLPQ
jgi:predicted secreted Zn-dependent protease